ncbi:MAG: ATP-binding cassette domain-containing protein [Candidatus Limnocylindria bacterium]
MTEVLKIKDLIVEYELRGGLLGLGAGRFRAVDGVDLDIEAGRTLALVGESGSGKTSVARAILGIAPLTSGRIWLLGQELVRLRGRARRQMQMVFQQPTASLDPRVRIADTIAEPLIHLLRMRDPALRERVNELLDLVGLDASFAQRLPRQLSGGQRQRVAIARAIAPSPALVICDEPTSSLDVSVQAQILNLLVRLQSELGLSFLFISHDLGTVRQIADHVAVMYQGRIVERGPADTVLARPSHEYTRALIAAVPSIDKLTRRGIGLTAPAVPPS